MTGVGVDHGLTKLTRQYHFQLIHQIMHGVLLKMMHMLRETFLNIGLKMKCIGPIIFKEAKAVYNLLQSCLSYSQNLRIDIHCDNLVVIQALESQKLFIFYLKQILKDIFQARTHNNSLVLSTFHQH